MVQNTQSSWCLLQKERPRSYRIEHDFCASRLECSRSNTTDQNFRIVEPLWNHKTILWLIGLRNLHPRWSKDLPRRAAQAEKIRLANRCLPMIIEVAWTVCPGSPNSTGASGRIVSCFLADPSCYRLSY